MPTTTTTETAVPVSPAATTRAHRMLGVLGAAAAAFLVWAVTVPGLGMELTAKAPPGHEVTAPGVLLASVVAGLAGWALLAVLERRSQRPGQVWTTVASLVLLVSLVGPLVSAASGTLALMAMHLAVGAVLIPVFARSARG